MILLMVGERVCFSTLKDGIYRIPFLPQLCPSCVAIMSLCSVSLATLTSAVVVELFPSGKSLVSHSLTRAFALSQIHSFIYSLTCLEPL